MSDVRPPPPAADWAWFLDVDGTLIHIAATPSGISIPAAVPALLTALSARYGGAVALVSGRTVENLHRLMAPYRPAAAGLHGLERVPADGRVVRPEVAAGLDEIRADLSAIAGGGILLEDKGLALAVHYRQAPDREAEVLDAVTRAAITHSGFRMQAGKMVAEIGPAGFDKGAAVRAFMDEPPFQGRLPVFIGDDVTDEYGFEAVNALGGISVLVGPARPSAARYRLSDVEECLAWLGEAAGVLPDRDDAPRRRRR